MSSRGSALAVGALLAVVLAGHLSLAPGVADLDSFYHLGHATEYAHGSIFDTSLPWATQSIIADLGADLWWGFHVVLLPFTAFADVATGIHVAAFVLTVLLALSVLWLFGRHGVRGAGWWAVLFLIAVPNVLYRFLMVRPHLLSLPASLLLLSFLFRGGWWQVALVSAGLAWIHLSLFWIVPVVLAAYTLVRLGSSVGRPPSTEPDAGVPLTLAFPAALGGMVAGWLLRPHPLATALLGDVQLVRLFLEKSTQQPLLFASELAPLPPLELVQSAWLFLAAWALALGAALVYALRGGLDDAPREERGLLGASLLLSAGFLALTLLSARRALVEWVAFGFVALPLLWSHVLGPTARRRVAIVGGALLVIHVPWGAYRHMLNVRYVAFPATALEASAGWLAANSAPGDIVFHTRWDNFGPLFARNRENRYLGGMDPIFQLAHDPRHYWEHFWLSTDIHDEWTCDAFPCPSGVATDTHEVLTEHFGARWVLVEPVRNPRFDAYLARDPRYELTFKTGHTSVYRILDPAG